MLTFTYLENESTTVNESLKVMKVDDREKIWRRAVAYLANQRKIPLTRHPARIDLLGMLLNPPCIRLWLPVNCRYSG